MKSKPRHVLTLPCSRPIQVEKTRPRLPVFHLLLQACLARASLPETLSAPQVSTASSNGANGHTTAHPSGVIPGRPVLETPGWEEAELGKLLHMQRTRSQNRGLKVFSGTANPVGGGPHKPALRAGSERACTPSASLSSACSPPARRLCSAERFAASSSATWPAQQLKGAARPAGLFKF